MKVVHYASRIEERYQEISYTIKISCTGYVVFSHHLEFSFWNNYFCNFYLKTCSMNFLGSFCYFYIPNFSQNEAEKQKLGSIHFWCSGEVVLSSCSTFNMHGYKHEKTLILRSNLNRITDVMAQSFKRFL